MSGFFATGKTRIVELPNSNFVTIRKFSTDVRNEIVSKTVKFKGGEPDINVGLMRSLNLKHGIVSWEGPDLVGTPLSSVGEMLPEITDIINAAIDEFNANLSDAEKKVLTGPTSEE